MAKNSNSNNSGKHTVINLKTPAGLNALGFKQKQPEFIIDKDGNVVKRK